MAFGVTATGFVAKRLPDIKAEIEGALTEVLGSGIDLTPESVLGQIVGVFAERLTLVWENMEDVYLSAYPDTAEGVALDNVGAILGIGRKGRSFSTVNVILYGTPGTLIEAGKRASVAGNPEAIFALVEDVTISDPIPEQQRISFMFGPAASGTWKLTFGGQVTAVLPHNATATQVQTALRNLSNISDDLTVTGLITSSFVVTFGGDMAGVDQASLILTDESLVDGDGDALFVFTNTITQSQPAQVAAAMKAIVSGPVLAPPNSLVVIETPVTGWSGLNNPFSAVVGNDLETDPQYRLRRAQTLQRSGAGTIEAIRSDLSNLNDVTHVEVFENEGMDYDDNGIPAKAFRVLIMGGNDQQIADVIWKDKPAGIRTDGNTLVPVVDSMGYSHDIRFSRPEEIAILVVVNITIDLNFPDNGFDLVAAAIAAKGNRLKIGQDVYTSPFLIASLDAIPGIIDADITVDKGDGPASSIEISQFEIATFDVLDVEVNEV